MENIKEKRKCKIVEDTGLDKLTLNDSLQTLSLSGVL